MEISRVSRMYIHALAQLRLETDARTVPLQNVAVIAWPRTAR
jgi:hypothetical protein